MALGLAKEKNSKKTEKNSKKTVKAKTAKAGKAKKIIKKKRIKPYITALYQATEALNPTTHESLRFNGRGRYDFAKGLYSIPINIVEFVAMSRRLPILFVPGDPPLPIALLSLTPGENKMVDDNGRWRRGHYIPAYLRRYPFIIKQNKRGNDVELSVDRSTDILSEDGKEPLFKDGKPTPLMQKYANFAAIYSREQNRTHAFAKYCQQKKLFRDGPVDIKATSKRGIHLEGFQVIDSKRLQDLEDEEIIHIWRQGWAAILFAHLDSLGHFGNLLE